MMSCHIEACRHSPKVKITVTDKGIAISEIHPIRFVLEQTLRALTNKLNLFAELGKKDEN